MPHPLNKRTGLFFLGNTVNVGVGISRHFIFSQQYPLDKSLADLNSIISQNYLFYDTFGRIKDINQPKV